MSCSLAIIIDNQYKWYVLKIYSSIISTYIIEVTVFYFGYKWSIDVFVECLIQHTNTDDRYNVFTYDDISFSTGGMVYSCYVFTTNNNDIEFYYYITHLEWEVYDISNLDKQPDIDVFAYLQPTDPTTRIFPQILYYLPVFLVPYDTKVSSNNKEN